MDTLVDEEELPAILILKAMLQQEQNCYRVHNYFETISIPTSHYDYRQSSQQFHHHDHSELAIALPVDKDARQQIAQWCMTVLDICNYSKEYTTITMSILDRFVSTSNGHDILLDRSQYRLAAITALYLTFKVHCPKVLSPCTITQLSRGLYTMTDIEVMELRILEAIQWRIHPPTLIDFVRVYFDIIISKLQRIIDHNDIRFIDKQTQHAIMELVTYQTNIIVVNFEITIEKSSHVAVAVLFNVLEIFLVQDSPKLYNIIYNTFFHNDIVHIIDINPLSLKQIQNKLYILNYGDQPTKFLDIVTNDNTNDAGNNKRKTQQYQQESISDINILKLYDYRNMITIADPTTKIESPSHRAVYHNYKDNWNDNDNGNNNDSNSDIIMPIDTNTTLV